MDFSRIFHHFFSQPAEQWTDKDALLALLPASDPEAPEMLEIALDGLVRAGFLERTGDPPRYRRKPDESLVVGRLRCSSKGFCFAVRDEPGAEDVYIHGSNLSGAWNGDQVIARITKEGNRRRSPEGEVVAVVERANPTLVGRLKQTEEGFRVVPLDDRLLFELALTEGSPAELAEGRVAYVEVERYPLGNLPPVGTIRKILGNGPEASIDADLVCCKYDLPQEFPPAVLEAAATLPKKLSRSDQKNRRDLRDWFCVTLEPLDLQHPHGLEPNVAVSLQRQEEGHWLLGVHIADVAHWLDPDHPLEREAQRRTATVYLDSVVLPLFPPEVHSRLALLPQQERLAYSLLLTIDPEGVVRNFEIHPSLVQSRAHLSYGQVQALLATAADLGPDEEVPELMALLQNLLRLSQVLRVKRHQAGGFDLPLLDLLTPYSADESGYGPLLVSDRLGAHALMTEILLLANQILGHHLRRLGIPSLARVQKPPTAEALQNFLRLANAMKLDLNLQDPEAVTLADWQRICARITAPDVLAAGTSPALVAQLLATLPPVEYCLQPLQEPLGHFGLGLKEPYASFTAPLRRYADLLNLRALHLALSKGRDRRSPRSKTVVDLHGPGSYDQIDWQVLPPKVHEEWQAFLQAQLPKIQAGYQLHQQAERELMGLKRCEFMQKHLGETFPGLIVSVQNYGFFVQVDPILAEGLVRVSTLKNDWYEYRSRQQALVGRKSRRQFRLGDRVEVQIKNVDYYRQQIDLAVIGEGRPYEEEE
ncbi:acetazolamide conferring resistance protein Zam [Synechococcus sp. 65AY6Li]|uniref:ribonuclease R family protein n=1 Tax=unclassified Synechococcus TaxID=2626047 RepID=UPI0000693F56|nr:MULTISPECIES: ribonuclease R family protein [unclassified Synechococcus]ABC98407.1 acetazolamide conferring resistance protein Zam [Synechococcus sp. JA-3-3Ab]PIK91443.1 acetazolamide conferring resistance protein Zam [Synechococcus sp. 65AY6Li]